MQNGLVVFAFVEESIAKVILGVAEIRLQLQRRPVLRDCFIDFPFLEKDDSEIVVSHPASGVSGQRRAPQRFDVSVHRTLSPREYRQHHHHDQHACVEQARVVFRCSR